MGISDLLAEKRGEILKIAERYGAHEVRVFGSVARGEAGPESDIDFVVQFEKGRSLFDQVHLIDELTELIGRPVDVVSERGLNIHIRDKILDEAVPL